MLSKRHTRPLLPLLTVTALSLAGMIGPLSAAQAGPDDGKIVATRSHIDAPKTYWTGQNFSLKISAPPSGGKAGPYNPDETVIWVGKGWSSRNGRSQYTFDVGDSPLHRFLGQPGDTLYMAPGLPEGNQDPAWVGYGADQEIPTERFRDGTFTLDIMEVNGPGEMELFSYDPMWGPLSLTRMMSSKTPGLNSALLSQGSHTHNETTFTTAGRYEVVYRTVARGLDGEVISSEPSTVVWQVGGKSPISGDGSSKAQSVEERYHNAPQGDYSSVDYQLSIKPYGEGEQEADDKLTQIDFTAASSELKGTLTLYNNGYFLTDLAVEGGKASWAELLGSTPGQLQAVFTPHEEHKGKYPRWVSHPLPYSPGAQAYISSQEGEGAWPQEQPDPDNLAMTGQLYTPVSNNFSMTVQPAHEKGYKVLRVKAEDPNFRGFLAGGFKDADSVYYTSPFEGHFVNGVAEYFYEDDGFFDNEEMVIQVIPHPDMNARSATVTLTDSYQSESSYSAEGTFELTETASDTGPVNPAPAPTPAPHEPAPLPPSVGSSGLPECTLPSHSGRYVLSEGHLDIRAERDRDGALRTVARDETGQISRSAVDRSLDELALAVGDNARQERKGPLLGSAFDFLGEAGSTFYGLPQTQQSGRIWPGWNTQDIDYSQVKGPLTLHMEPQSLPDGGGFAVYQDATFGDPKVLVDSHAGDYSLDVDFATHAHANWAFTTPGIYEIKTYYTAVDNQGKSLSSVPQTLVYLVGDQAIKTCQQKAQESGSGQQESENPGVSSAGGGAQGPGSKEPAIDSAPVGSKSTLSALEPTAAASSVPLNQGQGKQEAGQPEESSSGQKGQSSLAATGASVLGAGLVGAGILVAGLMVLLYRRSLPKK